jgi:hypothetical protein
MVEPSRENRIMIAAISSQPRERNRWASPATATSRLRVAKLTEMKMPRAKMNSATPTEPKMKPTVSVSTKPDVSWIP